MTEVCGHHVYMPCIYRRPCWGTPNSHPLCQTTMNFQISLYDAILLNVHFCTPCLHACTHAWPHLMMQLVACTSHPFPVILVGGVCVLSQLQDMHYQLGAPSCAHPSNTCTVKQSSSGQPASIEYMHGNWSWQISFPCYIISTHHGPGYHTSPLRMLPIDSVLWVCTYCKCHDTICTQNTFILA